MSDFTSSFWSFWVITITLGGIFGCALLLWMTSRKKVEPGADNTTGHVWDEDLTEMNNPLPMWWVGLFIITIVFSLLYLVAYPGLGSYEGELKWSTRGEYESEVAKANKELEPMYAQFTAKKTEELAGDPNAMAIGERLFMNNCAQCHGSDARGSKGFPNLADADWLHGGTPEKIKETITKGRIGMMPPMAAAVGSPDDVRNVAHYVLSLSGSPHDSVRAQLGKAKFAACAACHGPDGKGNQAIGAPNLSDDIWLHGWGENAIVAMVTGGKTNQMPAQEGKLTEAQIHVLASYVWSLSHKPASAKP
ncbi:cytochrome-c oxidase, cbb3-type subunit III [Ramlibacter monticola]|uniref:Cbb3-type cytochrome c oxidase subunit n=1 Tax=Ramlibacter monticola TaxID=1926872 RepID=A0A936Z478_9BURK|nr:cytochrome-c oxidase, cbb3-type subunit III [Ramlibacter monticola]MBL0393831.1 cytochrome-c oxidase, cbb3-type subunit III [Ramlibacter monticola]